jgi:predicted DNA-binding mobile mystery protein A
MFFVFAFSRKNNSFVVKTFLKTTYILSIMLPATTNMLFPDVHLQPGKTAMSSHKNLNLVRQQLDETLARFDSVFDLAPPSRGWIRAVRDALGMSGRQLACRLGLTQQSVARMEKNEGAGALTIKTLRRVAEGLDCVLVYGIVPRESLEKMVHDRARLIARKRMERVDQTMRLEDQELGPGENGEVLLGMIEDLVEKTPSNFWDAT